MLGCFNRFNCLFELIKNVVGDFYEIKKAALLLEQLPFYSHKKLFFLMSILS